MQIDDKINQYRIIDRIGEGGMGAVYLAEDTRLQRKVALKFVTNALLDSADVIARFHREARAAARLNHPNICTVYELGESEDKTFIVMEYVEGITLKERMQQGNIGEVHLRKWVEQIIIGLYTAHEAGVIHRDIKPANIMVTDTGLIKIMDFGIAKLMDAETELTQANSTIGTINYMSPEQARGEEVDQQTDIWSLGVILYELTTGQRPFDGAFREAIMYAMMHTDPELPSKLNASIPADIEHIINRCLQRDKTARYASLGEVLNDLEGASTSSYNRSESVVSHSITDTPTTIRDTPSTEQATLLGTTRRRIASVAIIALVGLLALFPGVRNFLFEAPDADGLPAAMHLAVLPFDTISNDPDDQAFSNGLAHLVATNLMRMEHDKEEMWIIPVREVLSRGVTSTSEAKDAFGINLALSGTIVNLPGAIQISLDVTDARTLRVIDEDVIEVSDLDPARIQSLLMARLADMLELQATVQNDLLAGMTDDPEAYKMYIQGLGLMQQYEQLNNVEEAIRLFEGAIERDSTFTRAYASVGFAYGRKYYFTKEPEWIELAFTHSDKAMALDSTIAEVLVTAGRLHVDKAEYEEAIVVLKKAIDADSLSYEAYRRLGTAYYFIEELEKAEVFLEKAVSLQPNYWDGYNMLGILLETRGESEYPEAIAMFEKVLELSENNRFAHLNIANIYLQQGDTLRGIQFLERSVAINPSVNSYWQLAWLARAQGNDQKAIGYYENAITLQENNFGILIDLGVLYEQAGDTTRAHHSWEKALNVIAERLEVASGDVRAARNGARTAVLLNRYDEAEAYIERYLALEYTAASLYQVSNYYAYLDDREKTLRYLELALQEGYSAERIQNASSFKFLEEDAAFIALIDQYR